MQKRLERDRAQGVQKKRVFLDRNMQEQWEQLCPELRDMLDERNMILV